MIALNRSFLIILALLLRFADRRMRQFAGIKMVTVGIEPTTVALLAQRSNQLSYATFLLSSLTPTISIEFFHA
jgi:hypothetical protein